MIRMIRMLVSSALLVGCASGPPPLPVEVRIPVAVPCIAETPARPDLLTDRDLAALDDYRLVLELARDRRRRQGYIAELEAVLAGCSALVLNPAGKTPGISPQIPFKVLDDPQ